MPAPAQSTLPAVEDPFAKPSATLRAFAVGTPRGPSLGVAGTFE